MGGSMDLCPRPEDDSTVVPPTVDHGDLRASSADAARPALHDNVGRQLLRIALLCRDPNASYQDVLDVKEGKA